MRHHTPVLAPRLGADIEIQEPRLQFRCCDADGNGVRPLGQEHAADHLLVQFLMDCLLKGCLARYFSASSPTVTRVGSDLATNLSSPSSPTLVHASLSDMLPG